MTNSLLHKLQAEDLFSGLNPENKQERNKTLNIEKSKALEEIIKCFELYVLGCPVFLWDIDLIEDYIKKFKNKYASKDVENFSVLLENYQNKEYSGPRGGGYLSILINYSNEYEFTLHTSHLSKKLSHIGYQNNGKKIIVNGNAALGIGRLMKSGIIIINGNVGDCLGINMSGGELMINGNVGKNPGINLRAGKIIINGYGGLCIGEDMIGGEIYLNEDYDCLSNDIKGGDIFHKGIQIIKNGKPIEGAKIKWQNPNPLKNA